MEEEDTLGEGPCHIYVNVCKCRCLYLLGSAQTEEPHLVAVVGDPPFSLGYGDSRHLSLCADQLADYLLVDPIGLRIPSMAALTAPNTKTSSSSYQRARRKDGLVQVSNLTE